MLFSRSLQVEAKTVDEECVDGGRSVSPREASQRVSNSLFLQRFLSAGSRKNVRTLTMSFV